MGETLAVAFARGLVLEQLADLGEREAGVVAEALDEAQPFEVAGVEEAVVAVGSGGRLQQPELLVVADRAGRQADFGRDLLDAEEARARSGVDRMAWWTLDMQPIDTTTLTFTLM